MGNLSYETTQTEVQTLFSEVGEVVEVFLPSDRNTGRPRGFAFVEFRDDAAAAEAIEKFNGHEVGGRRLRVAAAEDRRPRGGAPFEPQPSFRDRGSFPSSKPKGSRRNIRGKKRSL